MQPKTSEKPRAGNRSDERRRRRLSRRNLIDASVVDGYVFKFADTCEEVEAALRVVYACYRQLDLIAPCESRIRTTFHHLLPDTRILLAKKDGEVHSTLTMVVDGAFGLTMDHEFHDGLAPLRASGARLAEITSLATSQGFRQRNLFMYLYKMLLLVGREIGLTDFVLVINPKHVRFYRDILLFEQIGRERSYSAVGGAPGIPFRMNIECTLSKGERVYGSGKIGQDLHSFFSSPWEGGELAEGNGQPHDDATLRYLFRDILRKLDREQLHTLANLYRASGRVVDWQGLLGGDRAATAELV